MHILIVGAVRNCEKTLNDSINYLDNAFKFVSKIEYLIIESDSQDKTIEYLNLIKNSKKNFNFKSFGKLRNTIPERTKRIAFCRNEYLKFLRSEKYSEMQYLVVADFDGVINEINESKVWQSLVSAQLEGLIKSLPDGLRTKLGDNGVRLSGGEKQRLSIARAILKKSKIILLDEATSSLDAETETKIQEAIRLLTKNRTTLVIAHRLSTIMNSKKIYVVDNGSIVDEGSHTSLISNSEVYKNFYNKQLRQS